MERSVETAHIIRAFLDPASDHTLLYDLISKSNKATYDDVLYALQYCVDEHQRYIDALSEVRDIVRSRFWGLRLMAQGRGYTE